MTIEDLRHRQILAAEDVWRDPVWPLDPSEPRPPPVTTPAFPSTSSTPPPPQPTTTQTRPSKTGPSRRVSAASIPLRPRTTPPATHTSASAPPSSLEAKVDYLLTCVQLIGAHFSIPFPPFPTPAPPSPIVPSPIPSPVPSPHPQSSPVPIPTRKGKKKVPEHSAVAEDELDAIVDSTLDWSHDPEWIASTGLTPGAQQARIDAGETSDGKGTQSEESEEEDEEAAAAQFLVVPHELIETHEEDVPLEGDIGISIDDIDRSAAIEGADEEMDEVAAEIRQTDEVLAEAEDTADGADEADESDEETVSVHAQEDASVASGSPAASS